MFMEANFSLFNILYEDVIVGCAKLESFMRSSILGGVSKVEKKLV